MFEKGLGAAVEQAIIWRAEPETAVMRLAQVPTNEPERERVGSLFGMLGRLRERLSA